jgi:hypothetical protein
MGSFMTGKHMCEPRSAQLSKHFRVSFLKLRCQLFGVGNSVRIDDYFVCFVHRDSRHVVIVGVR